jgi:tape measure domain-containing protein
MSKTISNLSVGLFGDVTQFAEAFGKRATGAVRHFAGSLGEMAGKAIEFTGIGGAIAAAIGAVAEIGEGFKLAADFEQTTVAMETMLGSADKAKEVLGDLKKFAASTPFQFPELATTAKQLTAFQVDADNIVPTLKMLGDIAAGTGKPIGELAELYGKVKVQGRLAGEEIRQFTSAGIPLVALLAKQFGKTPEQIRAMVEAGQIGFPQVQKAFIAMTSEGGRFNGMMAKQATTVSGLFSTLKDTLGDTLQRVAETIIDTFNLKGAMAGLISSGDRIGNFFVGIVQKIAPPLKRVGSAIIGAFETAYGYVAPVVIRIGEVIGRTFTAIADAVAPVMQIVWGSVKEAWGAVYNFVAPIAASIYQTIADNWMGILQTVIGAGAIIVDAVEGAWGLIQTIAGTVWNTITDIWDIGSTLITGHSVTAGQAITYAWRGIAAAANWLADTVTLGFRSMEFAVQNWKATLMIAGLEMAAALSDMQDRSKYVADVMVYAAEYIYRNWKDIFTDLAGLTLSVFQNISTNIVEVMNNLPGLIKGTVGFSDIWKPLTDGFQSHIKQAFTIPEFGNSALTKQLEKSAASLEGSYGKGLGAFLTLKDAEAKSTAGKVANWIKDALGLGKPISPKIQLPPGGTPFNIKPVVPDGTKLSIAAEIKRADIIRFGSAEQQLLQHEWQIASSHPAAATNAYQQAKGAIGGVIDPAQAAQDQQNWSQQNDYLFKIWQGQTNEQVATF